MTNILNLNTLLIPITVEQPAGVDLRTEATLTALYYQIKDARNHARSIERQLFKTTDDENIDAQTHWQTVYQLTIDTLTHHSKDLEVTAWLIEALIRLHGFGGLNEGLQLTRKLIEQYWDVIYPAIDEEGLTTRLAPFNGLNGIESEGALIPAIANVPLTTSAQKFNLWQYQQAQELETTTNPKKREQKLAAGVIELKDFYLAAKQTGKDFYLSLSNDLKNCLAQLGKLDDELNKKCGNAAPPSSQIRNKLTAYLECITQIMANIVEAVGDGLKPSPTTEQIPGGDDFVQDGFVQTDFVRNGVVRNDFVRDGFKPSPPTTANAHPNAERDNALQTLSQIADYFRRTEMHSPIPYLLDRAVRWSKTPLPELLTELISDEGLRTFLYGTVLNRSVQ